VVKLQRCLVNFTDFPRTPLKTYYLAMPKRTEYHLVNEPFDYDTYKV